MRRIVKTLSHAFLPVALLAGAGASAQTAKPPTRDEQADKLCVSYTGQVCTTAQKQQLLALFKQVVAMPVADEYQIMARDYELAQGVRHIFRPDLPPLPRPPRDAIEESAVNTCDWKQQMTDVACTPAQLAEVEVLKRLFAELPPAIDATQRKNRAAAYRERLLKIFPDLTVQPPAQQGAAPASPV